jgi:tubulin polyglutamylase TTLL4
VSKMRRQFGMEYEICPSTYVFPEDYKRFITDRDNTDNSKAMWIMKPSASSCGRGIKVINKNSTVRKRHGHLVSKYVANPHLIRGHKYDLRIYVLVTSFDPLKVYLFKEGLVRFATEPYSTSSKNMKKRYIHLTNYSVNKKASNYQANSSA